MCFDSSCNLLYPQEEKGDRAGGKRDRSADPKAVFVDLASCRGADSQQSEKPPMRDKVSESKWKIGDLEVLGGGCEADVQAHEVLGYESDDS